ncbi:glycine betaine/L-proline ABC transporter substrate-binding protein ProX [Salinarimonas chemoclinalis]|uniref:glycine betaine/L-proline ABC transporter substrate-binding protein ProX n=1 Tax=Salinarimonas chemoclinalis TaxID=3241599 RepID=UPI003556509E
MRTTTTASAIALIAALGLIAQGPAPASAQDAPAMPGEGRTVQPMTSGIAEEIFQHEILFEGLRRLGYEVEDPLEGEYAVMHVALGQGDADFTGVHWNLLHQEFFENSGGEDRMVKLGTFIDNVLQGYLIDKATADEHGITNLEQLKDPEIAALFDANGDGTADLTGCNPGWGCELVIEHQIPEYGLGDTVRHNQGSYFALMADTIARFERGEPVLYYTWTPLWVSGVLVPGEDVEWLEVPYTSLPNNPDATAEDTSAEGKNLGFAVDEIRVLANRGWAEENPQAARFLELAEIPINDVSAQNLLMQQGEDSMDDIERHAREWIEENVDRFDAWLDEARAVEG